MWRNYTKVFNFDIKLKLPYFHEYLVYALEKFLQEKFSLISKKLKFATTIWISYNFQRGIRVQCKNKKCEKITGFSFIHSLCIKCTFIWCCLHLHSFYHFLHHPCFPTGKVSKVVFFLFQFRLFSPCIVLNNWSWKRKNANFKTFPVEKQGWHSKGQMLR